MKQAAIVSTSIVAAGIAAGLMIFPMVFAFGLEPGAGVGLTMITLPNVFNYISGGRIIGTLFYVGFYFAALSSAIGIGEAIVAVVMDGFHINRKKSCRHRHGVRRGYRQLLHSDSRLPGHRGRHHQQLSAGR